MRPGARPMELDDIQARLRPHVPALIGGAIAVALMLVWAVHDGGYDEDTWYWGALVFVAMLASITVARGPAAIRLSRPARVALLAFALYTAWSYLSITWASSPGDALNGSNRTLFYLVVFATMLVLPWTPQAGRLVLIAFALGVGAIAVVLLFRLAANDDVGSLIIERRLAAPTGYFNSTAALFTIDALMAIVLAARRDLPGLLRGVLLAFACASLQLAVVVQSRGWLFTLPLIALVTIVLVPDRLRVVASAILPVAGALIPLRRLLDVYKSAAGPALGHAASSAGHSALLVCAFVFMLGTLLAWSEALLPKRGPNVARRRVLGAVLAVIAVLAVGVGAEAATHGHPVRFIVREWNGFSHPETSSGSHFTDVGSSRYDFWRVALDAFVAHPIGGLGQDNFADYYVPRRRTGEEPAWTHSLELRLLTHTGIVGFLLFAVFLVAALTVALRARRRPGLEAAVAAAGLLPLVVWLIHGSIDWFWEMPALSGPALGFLGMVGALGCRSERSGGSPEAVSEDPAQPSRARSSRRARRALITALGASALVASVVVLAFPYLSVREVSEASDIRTSDPAGALNHLRVAAELNPLSANPGRVAGTIALQTGRYAVALQRFNQATAREPGGWYGWFGAGLAASALGERALARHDVGVAASMNTRQPAIGATLSRLDSAHPLSPSQALQMLVLIG
ncbi:MAG TPA: O-antigen ligase family protein [Solirubrobacteraceae bacterium]|nr:O-antigen ligase family protein [Solirubrobacteraceae bacterium]